MTVPADPCAIALTHDAAAPPAGRNVRNLAADPVRNGCLSGRFYTTALLCCIQAASRDAVRLDILAIDRSYPRVEALFELVRDVYSTSNHMSESFDEKYPAPSVLATEIAGLAERSGALMLVAERERRPQGYLTIEPRIQARLRHTADLHMGVHAAARGQGIGKRLLEDAIARVAEAQIVEIVYLMVRADNLPALGLYERSGFDRVATLPRDTKADGRYYDGVLMRRTVAPLAIPAER